MALRTLQTNFTAGELSSLLDGRTDLKKYFNGVYCMENFLVYAHGPATLRPGFRYVATTKVSATASRLIPFVYSGTDSFDLEFGANYIRFIKNRALITKIAAAWVTATNYKIGDLVTNNAVYYRCLTNHISGTFATDLTAGNWAVTIATDTAYELVSPYAAADVKEIKYCQSADVIYLWHPEYPPHKLSRVSDANWQINDVNAKPPPTTEDSISPNTTVTPDAVTGEAIHFHAGGSVFLAGDVGKTLRSGAGSAAIVAYVSATQVNCDIVDDFSGTTAIAANYWELVGSPQGTITPSITGPIGAICTITGGSALFRSSDVGKYIRLNSGYVKITTFTSATAIKAVVIKDLTVTTATTNWTLESSIWNATNGYPSCGIFYEERLITAGVPAFPENVRGSSVGDYENFTPGTYDSDAFDMSVAGRVINSIHWMEPREYLILGTTGSEWRLGPEDSGKAMTPLNVVAKQQTTFGCANIDPLTIRNCTLFVQRAKTKIREFTNNPSSVNIEYVAPDLTMLAEHITKGKVAGMCYQQEPFSIVWVWMENGELASMTYLRDEDVIGWARHPMDGLVESMCCIPGDGHDEVCAIIKRTINGVVVRYVEVLEKIFTDDADTFDANKGLNAFFVDAGSTYNGVPTTSITGAGHLEGEEVAILADGAVKSSQTVTGGQIQLSTAASVVHYGLPIVGTLTTMRPEVVLQDGSIQGKMKRIIDLIVRVYNSGTFKAGRDQTNLDEYGFATYDQTLYETLFRNSDTPTGSPVSLFTGDKKVVFDGDFNRDGRLTIVQDKPLPLTVVAIMAEMEVL